MNWSVYTIYAEDGECLYVGCSAEPWKRLGRHIGRVDVAYYDTEREALDAEVAAIKRRKPTLNVRSLVSNIGKKATYGSREAEVLAIVAAAPEPITSGDVAKAMGGYVGASALVMRLIAKGRLRVVGTTPGGYGVGRPAQLIVLASTEAAA